MSASMSGRGYRFVASDGGLFSFGDAPYAGSAAGKRLRDPIVGMAGSPTAGAFDPEAQVLTLFASHDEGLTLLLVDIRRRRSRTVARE